MKDTGYREEFRGTRAGSTRSGTGVALACALAVMLSSPLALADTDVPSANGHDWDVQDNTGADDGGIDDGGDDAFDDWGMLRLRTLDAGGTSLTSNQELPGSASLMMEAEASPPPLPWSLTTSWYHAAWSFPVAPTMAATSTASPTPAQRHDRFSWPGAETWGLTAAR